MLPETEAIPFDNLDALEHKLAGKKFAAFVVEPIQSEAGIRVPSPGYFRAAQELCRRYGTLLAMDEVQTGMYRTGPFLASHDLGAEPDMVVLAKAMSGGLIPVSAVLMTEPIYDSVYGSLRRSISHTSTFSENGLAMRAAAQAMDQVGCPVGDGRVGREPGLDEVKRREFYDVMLRDSDRLMHTIEQVLHAGQAGRMPQQQIQSSHRLAYVSGTCRQRPTV